MFGKKGLPKLDEHAIERLALGYLMAAEEIEELVETIKARLSDPATRDRDELRTWHDVLVRNHTRILIVGKSLPPADDDLPRLAKEAESMEEEIAQIVESVWGYDEARVSGLLLASGVLGSNV